MGYTTEFTGSLTITPPLNINEVVFLRKFNATRHCTHKVTPYAMDATGGCTGRSCIDSGPGVPGFWNKWKSSDDGTELLWDGREKFYSYVEWLDWLITHFFKPDPECHGAEIPIINGMGMSSAPSVFPASGHLLNGIIEWEGEESSDVGRIVVCDNVIFTQDMTRAWNPPRPLHPAPEATSNAVESESD